MKATFLLHISALEIICCEYHSYILLTYNPSKKSGFIYVCFKFIQHNSKI
jgi:hypothetical protein